MILACSGTEKEEVGFSQSKQNQFRCLASHWTICRLLAFYNNKIKLLKFLCLKFEEVEVGLEAEAFLWVWGAGVVVAFQCQCTGRKETNRKDKIDKLHRFH